MNTPLLTLMQCPICRADLISDSEQKVCSCTGARRHCFDFAKSKYLNLSGPHGGLGDKKDAIIARRAFLNAGYYKPLSDKLCDLLSHLGVTVVLDAGCGEGYYTNRFPNGMQVLGVDLSRDGIDAAAKTARLENKQNGFLVASLFSMPVKDSSLDAVVNIFAPCAEEEFLRVLKPGGYLILVGAGESHLLGLKKTLYENAYLNAERNDLPIKMTLVQKETISYEITVESNELIEALFSMTPYYWRTSIEDKEKLKGLSALTTPVDFDIFLFRKDD